MADKSSIEWTDATWNPLRGCSRVSEGCRNCYAERVAARFSGPGFPYEGLVTIGDKGPRWNGTVRVVPEHLADPLRWKKPRRIFVNSMSDLFHESVSNEDIAAIFGVMAAAPQHTFQVLTKRPKRMTEWFAWVAGMVGRNVTTGARVSVDCDPLITCSIQASRHGAKIPPIAMGTPEGDARLKQTWPLPNVWLGVSVEDQKTADERIWPLLETPAAIRFVSYEPALGPVNFAKWFDPWTCSGCEYHGEQFESGETRCADCDEDAVYDESLGSARCPKCGKDDGTSPDTVGETCPNCGNVESWSRDCGFKFQIDGDPCRTLDWIIVGGESGPGARLFDIGWARSVIEQGRGARVSVFVKQLGARPRSRVDGLDDLSWWKGPHVHADGTPRLADRAGGDMDEWPADLRVREFPEVRRG